MSRKAPVRPMCFYVAYVTMSGASWRIINTTLDLDDSQDLQAWIESEEQERMLPVVPTFWKRLTSRLDEPERKN